MLKIIKIKNRMKIIITTFILILNLANFTTLTIIDNSILYEYKPVYILTESFPNQTLNYKINK